MPTHKSRTALHLAASSNNASRLCSTDSASRPISVAVTENSGFPASCATLSRGYLVRYLRMDDEGGQSNIPAVNVFPTPGGPTFLYQHRVDTMAVW